MPPDSCALPPALVGPDVLSTEVVVGTTSVVIVSYNSARTIEVCVRSVLESGDCQVVVVDNASRDDTLERLAQWWQDPRVVVVAGAENLGFSEGCNVGLRLAHGEHLVLLNPDTRVQPGWIDGLRSTFDHGDRVGAVGPISNYASGPQKLGLWLDPTALPAQVDDWAGEAAARFAGTSAPTRLLIGFCMMLSRDAVAEVGGLDPTLFLGNDDLDLSWRLRLAGWELRVAPGVFVEHTGHVSFKTEPSEHVEALVAASTDLLADKLRDAYGDGRAPHPMNLWAMKWFEPTRPPWNG